MIDKKQVSINHYSDLLKLLVENTSDMGSFTLSYNEHKCYYNKNAAEIKEFYRQGGDEIDFEDDTKNIDFNKDIFELQWYKDTPVGFYSLYANNLDDLLKQVKETLEE